MPALPIAGVILCGGQSKRMGRVNKASLLLAGKPLLQHVIDRVSPQVERLLLSVESDNPGLAFSDLEQVADLRPGHNGPLGGLLSALECVAPRYDWLLLVPCDAPFLPRDLGERLLRRVLDAGRSGCAVRYDGVVQPTFSIWNRRLIPRLRTAVLEQGQAGFRKFLDTDPESLLDWEVMEPSPFFNVNDAAALAEAERVLSSENT